MPFFKVMIFCIIAQAEVISGARKGIQAITTIAKVQMS
jgi:hypothetical protein